MSVVAENKNTISNEDVQIVRNYVKTMVDDGIEMSSSAEYCLEMFDKLSKSDKIVSAEYWLKKAMAYAVGSNHIEYTRIFEKPPIVPELEKGDKITITAKQSWKLGFVREKGTFNKFLIDSKGVVYGISYYIPRLDMVGTVFLKDVNITKIKG